MLHDQDHKFINHAVWIIRKTICTLSCSEPIALVVPINILSEFMHFTCNFVVPSLSDHGTLANGTVANTSRGLTNMYTFPCLPMDSLLLWKDALVITNMLYYKYVFKKSASVSSHLWMSFHIFAHMSGIPRSRITVSKGKQICILLDSDTFSSTESIILHPTMNGWKCLFLHRLATWYVIKLGFLSIWQVSNTSG